MHVRRNSFIFEGGLRPNFDTANGIPPRTSIATRLALSFLFCHLIFGGMHYFTLLVGNFKALWFSRIIIVGAMPEFWLLLNPW